MHTPVSDSLGRRAHELLRTIDEARAVVIQSGLEAEALQIDPADEVLLTAIAAGRQIDLVQTTVTPRMAAALAEVGAEGLPALLFLQAQRNIMAALQRLISAQTAALGDPSTRAAN